METKNGTLHSDFMFVNITYFSLFSQSLARPPRGVHHLISCILASRLLSSLGTHGKSVIDLLFANNNPANV